jgi:hypothetical protein
MYIETLTPLVHPSEWAVQRCANEAKASLRDGDCDGADYLRSIVTYLLERIGYEPDADRSDLVHEVVDAAIPIWANHRLWGAFYDLHAWAEDDEEVFELAGLPPKFSGGSDWMNRTAAAALYLIGRRLGDAVIETLEGDVG